MDNNDENSWSLKSKSGKGIVCQRHTEVVMTEFRDKIVIIATECGKIGVMIQVLYETAVPEGAAPVLNSQVLFGKDEPEIHAAACSLMELLNFRKTVIFGFAFKEYTATTVSDLKDLIFQVNGKGI